MENQTYQSAYIPGVWYTKYGKPQASLPSRRDSSKVKPSPSERGVSSVTVVGVLLVVALTAGALAVAVFFGLKG